MAQADSSFRSSIDELNKYYVRNSQGGMVPLGSLVTSSIKENPALISHYNIYRSIEVNGSPKPGYSSGDAINALKEVAAKSLPNGYDYEFAGMSREEIRAGNTIVIIFSISIIFVFLFLLVAILLHPSQQTRASQSCPNCRSRVSVRLVRKQLLLLASHGR